MGVSRIFLLSGILFVALVCLACSSDEPNAQNTDQGTTGQIAAVASTNTSAATNIQIAQNDNQLLTKPAPPLGETGQSKGYLTTPDELAAIQVKAEQGIEPYQSAVKGVLV